MSNTLGTVLATPPCERGMDFGFDCRGAAVLLAESTTGWDAGSFVLAGPLAPPASFASAAAGQVFLAGHHAHQRSAVSVAGLRSSITSTYLFTASTTDLAVSRSLVGDTSGSVQSPDATENTVERYGAVPNRRVETSA